MKEALSFVPGNFCSCMTLFIGAAGWSVGDAVKLIAWGGAIHPALPSPLMVKRLPHHIVLISEWMIATHGISLVEKKDTVSQHTLHSGAVYVEYCQCPKAWSKLMLANKTVDLRSLKSISDLNSLFCQIASVYSECHSVRTWFCCWAIQ